MSILLEIDKYQRKIISLLFRLLIISYSVFLLIINNSNFSIFVNIVVFIAYVALYILLLKKSIWISILRLLNDYVFITFIIYQINEINIYTFALLFAPILNTHNHTGDKKTFLLYIFPIFSIFYIEYKINMLYLIPFILFFLINSFDNIRTKYFRFQQRLNSVIDNFFLDDSMLKKPYKIYEKAIPIINNSKILPKKISKIICVKIERNKIIIVNGSSFIWDFDVDNKKQFIEQVRKHKIIHNYSMKIDDIRIENNIINSCSVNSHYYCYIMISENEESFNHFIYSFFISKLISPFFHRLSRIFDADYKQKTFNLEKIKELETKINYVSNSVNAMHFIRNKLGPIKSYLAMVEDYNTSTDENKKAKIKLYIDKEREKLVSSLNEILQRADYILKKSNNPFNVYDINKYGLQQLFSTIRQIWIYHFDIENFKINLNIQNQKEKYVIEYNIAGIELVLTNWISNMYKHNTGEYGISFEETNDEYIIIFMNSLDISNSKFVSEYSTNDRNEIVRRNSNGLLEIKDFLSQMKIDNKMYIKDNLVYFELKFKKYLYNENTNN